MAQDLSSQLQAFVDATPPDQRAAAGQKAQALLAGGAKSMSDAIAQIGDRTLTPAARAAAAWAAAQAHDATAVTPLVTALEGDHDTTVKEAAAAALGQLADANATRPLVRRLFDRQEAISVRVAAVTALPKLKDPHAIVPMCAALFDKDAVVRFHAADALGALGLSVVLPALNAATRDRAVIPGLGAVADRARQAIAQIQKAS